MFEKDTPIVFPAEDPLPSTFKFFPTPKMVLSKSTEQLRLAGLSQRKTEYIQDLARVFDNKTINGELLGTMSDEEISDLLCSVKGVGQVTQKNACIYIVLTKFSFFFKNNNIILVDC